MTDESKPLNETVDDALAEMKEMLRQVEQRIREHDSDLKHGLAEEQERVRKLEASLRRLADAVEHHAALEAYRAGFGASEWEAFVTPHEVWVALTDARETLSESISV